MKKRTVPNHSCIIWIAVLLLIISVLNSSTRASNVSPVSITGCGSTKLPSPPPFGYTGAKGLASLTLMQPTGNEDTDTRSYDRQTEIMLLTDGGEIRITLHDYLVGVVAAEMPAFFSPEALKAQAVASRSCTVYNLLMGAKHEDAHMCAMSSCCQAYSSDAVLAAKWGDDYDEHRRTVEEAVSATDGLCLFYDGKLIYAPYHSSSYLTTENSGQIWSDTPYLVSVASPETDELVPNFVVTTQISTHDAAKAIIAEYPQFTADNGLVIEEITYAPSGRLGSITINGLTISGSKLRSLLSLRSTNIQLQIEGDTVIITTYGWGHGVGMSQYGADIMAGQGADFTQILKWYYSGIEISAVPSA